MSTDFFKKKFVTLYSPVSDNFNFFSSSSQELNFIEMLLTTSCHIALAAMIALPVYYYAIPYLLYGLLHPIDNFMSYLVMILSSDLSFADPSSLFAFILSIVFVVFAFPLIISYVIPVSLIVTELILAPTAVLSLGLLIAESVIEFTDIVKSIFATLSLRAHETDQHDEGISNLSDLTPQT